MASQKGPIHSKHARGNDVGLPTPYGASFHDDWFNVRSGQGYFNYTGAILRMSANQEA